VTTNIWANAWTIEAWVYPTGSAAAYPTIFARSNAIGISDLYFGIDIYGVLKFNYGSTSAQSGYYGYTPPYNTWTHVAVTYDATNNKSNLYAAGTLQGSAAIVAAGQTFIPNAVVQVGAQYGANFFIGNLADVRVSNVALYTGSTYTVPTAPFATDSNTLLLLKSLAGQVGTTLQVQGRGLNAVSLGATRSVQSYPPAPMSSYLLDTTSNASVTYGQGKYVASASSEFDTSGTYATWKAFDKTYAGLWVAATSLYSPSTSLYSGSVRTVDVLGNSYAGEWLQIQLPVSTVVSSYSLMQDGGNIPNTWSLLGSRDGINWTLVDYQAGITSGFTLGVYRTFTVSATQAYNYFRIVFVKFTGSQASVNDWFITGTEESLCVTSDSKVGVGIANPQRALEVAGDLVVGGTISGGAGMGSFRNRIINGDMRIAQRGTSNVISTGAGAQFYMIDRFAFNSNFSTQGLLTQTQQTLTASDTPYQTGFRYSWRITTNTALTAASYGYTEPQQIIEGYNISDLNWGTSFGSPITVSFWFRTNLAPGLIVSATIRGGAQYAFPFAVTGNGTWQYVTATVPPPPNGGTWNSGTTAGISLFLGARGLNSYQNAPNAWITVNYSGTSLDCNPYATAGNYIEFTGVQLEKGTVATPFEFRPFATELQLCQRYFTQLGGQSIFNAFGVGIANQATTANIRCFLPVPMRSPANASATGVSVGNMVLNGNVAGTWSTTTVTAINWNYQNINEVGITATVAGGLGINWPYILAANNSLSPLIQINNEL